ncbi:unnamed protein product, partial [Nesidiocoris tenuis]
ARDFQLVGTVRKVSAKNVLMCLLAQHPKHSTLERFQLKQSDRRQISDLFHCPVKTTSRTRLVNREEVEVKRLSVVGLLPDTEYYMTYDGSTTMPPCHETLTWVILNKPIYITKQQLHGLRRLMQGDVGEPKAPLGNNFRPPQPLHHRPLRTNIDFNVKQAGAKQCPSMYKEVYYKANSWKLH